MFAMFVIQLDRSCNNGPITHQNSGVITIYLFIDYSNSRRPIEISIWVLIVSVHMLRVMRCLC